MLSPITELYYDGPMGGYGANLKAQLAGYQIISAEGLCYALQLRQLNVPVINTPDAFTQFIKQTPMMSRGVAIIEHNSVMCRSKVNACYESNEKTFYAVVYEKRTHSDALYLYNSETIEIDLDYLNSYFKSKFFLFTPDQIRKPLGLSSLYAIQDASYLMSHLKTQIDAPLLMKLKPYQFHLDDRFFYNEKSLIQDHVTTIIDAAQNSTSSFQQSMQF